jgi:hypothetical protein
VGTQHGSRVAHANFEESTGACLACPTYFRGKIAEAKRGGAGGYAHAGWHLAVHLAGTVDPESKAEAALYDAIETRDEPEVRVLEWMSVYLPRCYDLVPQNRHASFAAGIARAIDEGRLS